MLFRSRSYSCGDRSVSRVAAIIYALVICIIVCLSWAVNHYRDNAIAYKEQRDKKVSELKQAIATIADMQQRQRDVAALDAKYSRELANAKAENETLRADVAAGRRRLHAHTLRAQQKCVWRGFMVFDVIGSDDGVKITA